MKGLPVLRMDADQAFVTENGNHIFDVDFGLLENPVHLASQLDRVVGIIEHGLFIHLTDEILMASGDQIMHYTLSKS